MNREIKFRAWDGERIVDHFTLNPDGHTASLYIGGNWKLMQFTGLKDKNGTDIYEGDLLQSQNGRTWLIVWAERGARFQMQLQEPPKKKFDGRLGPLTTGAQQHLVETNTVIGNIYENPELTSGNPATVETKSETPQAGE